MVYVPGPGIVTVYDPFWPVDVEIKAPPAFGVTVRPTPGRRASPAVAVPRMTHGSVCLCRAASARMPADSGSATRTANATAGVRRAAALSSLLRMIVGIRGTLQDSGGSESTYDSRR
jgi:hypothetical protein